MPTRATQSLQSILAQHAAPAAEQLVETLPDGAVRCLACAHRCVIKPGKTGICKVRFNRDGVLHVPHGYVEGLAVDPIEKKPFYHVAPGSMALSFGMLGCNFHCGYCQNWISAQALRDERAVGRIQTCTAEQLVDLARREKCRSITSTYNEPLITTEWAVEVFKLAKPHGLLCGYVSNGHATPEVLRYLREYAELFKIDLKTFNDRSYRSLGGTLQAVLDTITLARQLGFWVEIVTLVVPQLNDSPGELADIARFIASVSPDIPWHVTAFHPDYKMTDRPRTSAEALLHAYEIGREAGLKFIYAGNLPGLVQSAENTYCPDCGSTLIERFGFYVRNNRLGSDGICPDCGTAIPGIWA